MWWQRDLTPSTRTRDSFSAHALSNPSSDDDQHRNADIDVIVPDDNHTKDQGNDNAEKYSRKKGERETNVSKIQNIGNEIKNDKALVDKYLNSSTVDDDSSSEVHYYSAQEDQEDKLHQGDDEVGHNEVEKGIDNKKGGQHQSVAQNESLDWTDSLFERCKQDFVALAQDLVEKSKSDECKRMMLESLAHRILQEMLLVETTKSTSRDYGSQLAKSANNKTDGNDNLTFVSPYRGKYHAEQRECLFDIFNDLLDPNGSPAARDKRDALFGNSLGERMTQACPEIWKLGMLFSPQWRLTYEIPDELLLCCIDARKFERADPPSLRNVVEEFGLWQLLLELLDDWGLDTAEWFKDLFSRVKEDGWNSSSKTDLQCLLFVCRAYRKTQALKWTNIRGSLAKKVIRCLEILQRSSKKMPEATPPGYCTNPQTTAQTKKGQLVRSKPSMKNTGCHESEEGEEAIETKCATMPTDVVMKLPVEKVCLKTGKLLHTFDTAEAARRSVSDSKEARDFKYVLQGSTRRGRRHPHEYHGYFWRLRGSKRKPDMHVPNQAKPRGPNTSSSHIQAASAICNGTESCENVCETQPRPHSLASLMDPELNSNCTIESRCRSLATDVILEMPVEKICLNTGKILQSFDNSLAAQRSVTATGNPRTFKYVLIGNGKASAGRPHIRHGYFWRLKGSKAKPKLDPPMDSTPSYRLPLAEESVDCTVPCIATIPTPEDRGWSNKTISVTITFDNKTSEYTSSHATISHHDEPVPHQEENVDKRDCSREPSAQTPTLLESISDNESPLKNGTKRHLTSDFEQTPTKRPRENGIPSDELTSDSSRMMDSDYTRSECNTTASNDQVWNLGFSTSVASPGSNCEEITI